MEGSDALQHIDKYGETPLFDCPRCDEESAKANVPLHIWHCTACDASGWISGFGAPNKGLPATRINDV